MGSRTRGKQKRGACRSHPAQRCVCGVLETPSQRAQPSTVALLLPKVPPKHQGHRPSCLLAPGVGSISRSQNCSWLCSQQVSPFPRSSPSGVTSSEPGRQQKLCRSVQDFSSGLGVSQPPSELRGKAAAHCMHPALASLELGPQMLKGGLILQLVSAWVLPLTRSDLAPGEKQHTSTTGK